MDKTITQGSGTLFYRDTGSGVPVLLVHGFAEDGAVWDEVAAGLGSRCRVLVPDLPGSGRSSLLAEETTMESLAAALKSLLNEEGIERCVMIGHSMGGYITLAFAERYPESLLAFGFFSSTAFADSEEKKAGRQKSIAFIRQRGAAPYIRQSIPTLFAEATRAQRPELVEDMIRRYSGFDPASLEAYLEAMRRRPDRRPVLERSVVPVLLIIGEKDQLIPLEQSLQQAHLPRIANIRLLPEAGHMGMLEDGESGGRIIQSFVNFIVYL